MKKDAQNQNNQDMLDEYDFSSGIRGKYSQRYAEGTNIIILDPDVAKIFTDSKSVNSALRSLAELINKHTEQFKLSDKDKSGSYSGNSQ